MLQWGHDKIVMEVTQYEIEPVLAHELQWGHDKIVMEVSKSFLHFVFNSLLQWGHDKIVMEVTYSVDYTVRDDGFNGAMTK